MSTVTVDRGSLGNNLHTRLKHWTQLPSHYSVNFLLTNYPSKIIQIKHVSLSIWHSVWEFILEKALKAVVIYGCIEIVWLGQCALWLANAQMSWIKEPMVVGWRLDLASFFQWRIRVLFIVSEEWNVGIYYLGQDCNECAFINLIDWCTNYIPKGIAI